LDALLATYGVFAAGFLMRPLGAMFFGNLGDARGRKTALTTQRMRSRDHLPGAPPSLSGRRPGGRDARPRGGLAASCP
jgi:hypothetical protein